MRATLRRQAVTLTLANGYTRGIGFAMRLVLARLMGAEAMGVMELSHSVIMLAITPVTSGIPAAMSRLTAQRNADEARTVLRAGQCLVLSLSMILAPALLLLSPALAWLLGDMRTLPSILTSAPDVLLLGLCAACCGYCYGLENMRAPALNECAEQTIRFLLAAVLLTVLKGVSVAWRAALPSIAESVAGVCVLLLFHRTLRGHWTRTPPDRALMYEIFRLASPMTLSRLCLTGMRALNAVLLPVCLRRSGLSTDAATAQFGLLNGMAMPLMMLPGVVTGAICMMATPAVSRREHQPRQLRQLVRLLTLAALGIGLAAAGMLFLLSDFLGLSLYRTAALGPLIRLMCPMALIFSTHQVLSGAVTGLGLQQKTLSGTIAGSVVTLLLTALLTPLPYLRLYGAALAMLAGHLVRLLWCAVVLARGIR